jgi:hypothetical protein
MGICKESDSCSLCSGFLVVVVATREFIISNLKTGYFALVYRTPSGRYPLIPHIMPPSPVLLCLRPSFFREFAGVGLRNFLRWPSLRSNHRGPFASGGSACIIKSVDPRELSRRTERSLTCWDRHIASIQEGRSVGQPHPLQLHYLLLTVRCALEKRG